MPDQIQYTNNGDYGNFSRVSGDQFNNLNTGRGTQNINNGDGIIYANHARMDSEDEDEDGPLPAVELRQELRIFKRLYPKLNESELKNIQNAQEYLDKWQRINISDLAGKLISSADKIKLLHAMAQLAQVSGLAPKCLWIQDVGIKVGNTTLDGHSTDTMEIYKGKAGKLDVIVKALKTPVAEEQLKMLLKQAITWQKVQHDNILPFLGLYYFDEARSRVCVVYEWMEQRSLAEEVPDEDEQAPDGNNLDKLANGVIDGLRHIHAEKIIHGDLQKSNLLIDQVTVVRIADLGLAQVLDKATDRNEDSDKYKCARLLCKEYIGKITSKNPTSRPAGMPNEIWVVLEEWLKKGSPGGGETQ